MSTRFVAAGTDEVVAPAGSNADWERAKQQVESRRAVKSTDLGTQDGGKSLYDVLQANKAAKEEAFEEANRLRNQFRALDDSEIEFLESVRESEREKENLVKSETAEQLDLFRRQRIAAEQAAAGTGQESDAVDQPPAERSWVTSKKRRRKQGEEDTSKTKLRKSSSNAQAEKVDTADEGDAEQKPALSHSTVMTSQVTSAAPVAKPAGLGLAGYGSDSEDN